jgi:hypothetical protein
MIAVTFFSWWYGRGWNEAIHSISKRVTAVSRTFSIRLLFKTLFSPWRRIISYPGASLAAHAQAWTDNVVSRAIGFVVRVIVLLAAFITIIFIVMLSCIEMIVWPLLPPGIIACLILGVIR